jgi:hypothetical protein
MAPPPTLLFICTEELYAHTLALSVGLTGSTPNWHWIPPRQVDSDLQSFDTERLGAIVIAVDSETAFDENGIQLIQRLRIIHRLRCSMILLSYERDPGAAILTIPGHFFLPRPFRLSDARRVIEEASMIRLSSAELQRVTDEVCDISQSISIFHRRMRHGLGHVHADVRFAFNGIRPSANLLSAKRALHTLRHSRCFTDLKGLFSARFTTEFEQIDAVFNQIQQFIEDAQRVVDLPGSPSHTRIKHQVNQGTGENPFIAAPMRICAVLDEIDGMVKSHETVGKA